MGDPQASWGKEAFPLLTSRWFLGLLLCDGIFSFPDSRVFILHHQSWIRSGPHSLTFLCHPPTPRAVAAGAGSACSDSKCWLLLVVLGSVL